MGVLMALEKIYNLIFNLSKQVTNSHGGDEQRIEFLRDAVIWNYYSLEPLSLVANHRLSFQQINGYLEAAV